MTDWTKFRACDACKAKLGEPCRDLSGATRDGEVTRVAERPHSVRRLRTGSEKS